MAKIEVGDTIPSFSLYDQDSSLVYSKDLIGGSKIVIYFYPKDDTPGCTKEACGFRDNMEAFNDFDAVVIGISSDDVDSHKNFADKYRLNFTLLSDLKGKVRKQFGVESDFFGFVEGRETFIVDESGIVIHKIKGQLNPAKHINEALVALQSS
jgi:peroxiredoxin Q/BCP